MDDTDRDGGHASDPDSVRALVLGLLDRIEHFATTVISDRPSAPGSDPYSADVGAGVRAAVDGVIAELGEFVNNLIAAVIAVLEAISAALDEAIGARGRNTATGRRPARSGSSFQTIAVEVEMGDPQT